MELDEFVREVAARLAAVLFPIVRLAPSHLTDQAGSFVCIEQSLGSDQIGPCLALAGTISPLLACRNFGTIKRLNSVAKFRDKYLVSAVGHTQSDSTSASYWEDKASMIS
jgi:hypothetical protein